MHWLRASASRLAGGGAAKPAWRVSNKHYFDELYQPSIPNKHFYSQHPNYPPFTIWLRRQRATIENVGLDIAAAVKCVNNMGASGYRFIDIRLPGALHMVAAGLGALLATSLVINQFVTPKLEAHFEVDKLLMKKQAQQLKKERFFDSDQQDMAYRADLVTKTEQRLNSLFDKLLQECDQKRSFQPMIDALDVDKDTSITEAALNIPVLPAVTWTFGTLPENAEAFPSPDTEKAGNMNLYEMGSYGTYESRTDNKGNPARKVRNMYATAYIPPTK